MRFQSAIFLVLLFALPPVTATAQGNGVQVSATLGIGGRYRPGGWIPVTVGVVNPGSAAIQGQVQVTALDPSGQDNASAVFSRPSEIPPGASPQFFQVDTRGIDPGYQNVAIRVVGGEARGDEATVAQISSLADAKHNLIAGTPVAGRDLLLVGLTADSTAITRLNGQQWGLMHTAKGIAPDQPPTQQYYGYQGGARVKTSASGNAALVEAGAALPAQMPDRPAGYDGVDAVVLRGDAPLDALTEAQTDALRGWIAAGGQLIVCGGADPTPYGNSFYTGLLPADVSAPRSGASALTLTPKPLPGVWTLSVAKGQPAAVTGPYGAGHVTMLASDPASDPSGTAEAGQWKSVLLAASPSSMLGVVGAHEADSNNTYYGDSGQLSDAVMRAPALDAPGAGVVALFLIGYLLVLVPINYLVLKRLDKKEWSWATIPALVLVFAAATYGVGYASKGSSVFVNRAAIVETTAGQTQAGAYAAIGLFSPRRALYDLTISDPNALSAIPQQPQNFYNPSYGRNDPDSNAAGQTRFVEGGEDEKLLDVSANMWAMRAFDVQGTASLGGSITSTLARTGTHSLISGSIANHTPYALTHCSIYFGSQWTPLGDLAPGGSRALTALFIPPASGSAASIMPAMPSPVNDNGQDPARGTIGDRMTAALASFVSSVDGANNGGQYYYGYASNTLPPAVFHPRADEAILTGWCDNPALGGPPVRVDGHAVTQNSVTLVVVHIPLHGP